MDVICLHDKETIEAALRGAEPSLQLYALGDLDDFFWPQTVWYALMDRSGVRQLVLLYTGLSIPVLLAHADPPPGLMGELVRRLLPLLPRRFYGHLGEEAVASLSADYEARFHGTYWKMGLIDPSCLEPIYASEVTALSEADLEELTALYEASYPGHWFVPRMLETGFYFGVRRSGRLLSVAGVHVYSQHYRVAALGNVATHPDARGQGLATAACAQLCRALLDSGVEHVGLNVRAENQPAIACYRSLGFEQVASYAEYTLTLKPAALPDTSR